MFNVEHAITSIVTEDLRAAIAAFGALRLDEVSLELEKFATHFLALTSVLSMIVPIFNLSAAFPALKTSLLIITTN